MGRLLFKFSRNTILPSTGCAAWYSVEVCRCQQCSIARLSAKPVEKQEVMFRLRNRDWIIPIGLIVAGIAGYGIYSEWAGPRFEAGLGRTEADLKSNLPMRVDQNTTLVDVKYERTHSAYWYVIDKPDQFDPQETARQVQIGVCTNADNSRTMKKEGFSYEYHYRTKEGLALTDFKITTCE